MRDRVTRYAGLLGAPDRRRFKNMFAPSLPPPPPVQPPPRMPDPNDPAAMAAQKQALARLQVGGRSSTMLTRPAGTIAGAAYSGGKLGG